MMQCASRDGTWMQRGEDAPGLKPKQGDVKRVEANEQVAMKSDGNGRTHDWALDLEPLALPPDLPPVILDAGGEWVVKLKS